MTRLFPQAETALARKDDSETLAVLAEHWALQEKYIGIDRSGMGDGSGYDYAPFDQWVDELMDEASRRAFGAVDPDNFPAVSNPFGGAGVISEATRIARDKLGREPTQEEVNQVLEQLGGDEE